MTGTAVCGFYGRANLGDEAILSGIVDALHEARPGEQVLALSSDPVTTARQHGIHAAHLDVGRRGTSWRRRVRSAPGEARLARQLLSCERFLLGGGDLLRDSPTQEVVLGWTDVLRTAQQLRRRTAVLGVSVGELWKTASVDAIRRALDGCRFVVTRDEASSERLRALDVQTEVETAPDLALRVFPPDDGSRIGSGRPRVLVAVRGLADRADDRTAQSHDAALDRLAAALDQVVDDLGADVELVPFRSLPARYQSVDDDYVASLELTHRARNGHRFVVHRHVEDVVALRELLRGASVVVGMRLHAVIMAVGLGVPVVALSYDRKVRNFCDETGVRECWDVDDLQTGELVETVRRQLAGPRRLDRPVAEAYRARTQLVVDRLRDWS